MFIAIGNDDRKAMLFREGVGPSPGTRRGGRNAAPLSTKPPYGSDLRQGWSKLTSGGEPPSIYSFQQESGTPGKDAPTRQSP